MLLVLVRHSDHDLVRRRDSLRFAGTFNRLRLGHVWLDLDGEPAYETHEQVH